MATKNSLKQINDFKNLIIKTLLVSEEERKEIRALPLSLFDNILTNNFSRNVALATRAIMANSWNTTPETDQRKIDSWVETIPNLKSASQVISNAIQNKEPFLFITDIDNDGSFSQTVINLFVDTQKSLGNDTIFDVEYSKDGSREISINQVNKFVERNSLNQNDNFTIVISDLATNEKDNIKAISDRYPNAKIIISDHHVPNENHLVEENQNIYLVNPKHLNAETQNKELFKKRQNVNPAKIFEEYSLSGASILTGIFKEVFKNQNIDMTNERMKNTVAQFNTISQSANLLDYVYSPAEARLVDLDKIDDMLSLQSKVNSVLGVEGLLNASPTELDAISQHWAALLSNNGNKNADDIKEQLQQIQNELSNLELHSKLTLHFFNLEKQKEDDNKEILEHLTDFYQESNLLRPLDEAYSFEDALNVEPLYKINQNLEKTIFEGSALFNLRASYLDLKTRSELTEVEKSFTDYMQKIFDESYKVQKRLYALLQETSLSNDYETENVIVRDLDSNVIDGKVFSRKLFSKAFPANDKQFVLNIDKKEETKLSGSFRSKFDFSEISQEPKLKDFLAKNNLSLEVVGHERAAGFILEKATGFNEENRAKILEDLSKSLEESIIALKNRKEKEFTNNLSEEDKVELSDIVQNGESQLKSFEHTIVSLDKIPLVNKMNDLIKGFLPHNSQLEPVIQIDSNAFFKNNSSPIPFSLKEKAEEVVRKNNLTGYTSLSISIDSKNEKTISLIMPNAFLVNIANSTNPEEFFLKTRQAKKNLLVVEGIMSKEEMDLKKANGKVIEWDTENKVSTEIQKKFENQQQSRTFSREELKTISTQNTPSEKAEKDFAKQEQFIVELLAQNDKKAYITLDVEADGLGFANLLNIGLMKYEIKEGSGKVLDKKEEEMIFFKDDKSLVLIKDPTAVRLLSGEEELTLRQNGVEEGKMIVRQQQNVVENGNDVVRVQSFLVDKEQAQDITNISKTKNGQFIVNQEVVGERIVELVNQNNIPTDISLLTNIKQSHLNEYGKPFKEIDIKFSKYIQELGVENVLVGAHNTEYDLRIIKGDLPLLAEVLQETTLFDTAKVARKEHLALFNEDYLIGFGGIKNGVFRNDNSALVKFLRQAEDPEIIQSVYSNFRENGFLKLQKGQDDKVELYFVNTEGDNKVFTLISPDIKKDLLDKLEANQTNESLMKFIQEREKENSDIMLSLKGTAIQENHVKFSVQALAVKQGVDNILNHYWNKTPTAIIPTESFLSKESKETLSIEDKNAILRMQQNYDFSTDFLNNLRKNQILITGINDLDFNTASFKDNGYVSISSEVLYDQFLPKFKEENKEKFAIAGNAWVLGNVLKEIEPTYQDSQSPDVISKLSAVLSLPNDEVKNALEQIVVYKQETKQASVVQNEIHVNGVDGGDIELETALNLSLLMNKHNSSLTAVEFVSQKSPDKIALNETVFAVDKFTQQMNSDSPTLVDKLQREENYAHNQDSYEQIAYKKANGIENAKTANVLNNTLEIDNKAFNVVKIKPSKELTKEPEPIIYMILKDDVDISKISLKQVKSDIEYLLFVGQQTPSDKLSSIVKNNSQANKEAEERLAQHFTGAVMDSTSDFFSNLQSLTEDKAKRAILTKLGFVNPEAINEGKKWVEKELEKERLGENRAKVIANLEKGREELTNNDSNFWHNQRSMAESINNFDSLKNFPSSRRAGFLVKNGNIIELTEEVNQTLLEKFKSTYSNNYENAVNADLGLNNQKAEKAEKRKVTKKQENSPEQLTFSF